MASLLINMPDDINTVLQRRVDAGEFASIEDAVVAVLRHHEAVEILHAKARVGFEQIAAGNYVEMDAGYKERFLARARARHANGDA